MFPTGGAGVALVVLRSVVAFAVLVDADTRWTSCLTPIIHGLLALLGLCLLLGFLTPYCATLSCLIELTILVGSGTFCRFEFAMSALIAAATALLGPGAYSLDSRIFGRKLITIPARRNPG